MICKKCNSQIPDDAVFCTNCGAVVEEDDVDATGLLMEDAPVAAEPVYNPPTIETPVNTVPAYNTGSENSTVVNPAYENPYYSQQPVMPVQPTQPVQPVNNQYQNYTNYNQGYVTNAQQPPVEKLGLWGYYKKFWKNYANFNGRARRAEFWNVALANMIIMFGFSMTVGILTIVLAASGASGGEAVAVLIGFVVVIYTLAILVPSLALNIRRLHDIGKDWYWIFISLIPWVGSIILIVFYCMDSQSGPNKFGPNPKGM